MSHRYLLAAFLLPALQAPALAAPQPTKADADRQCKPGSFDEGEGSDWSGGLHPTAGGLTPIEIPGAKRISPMELNCLAGVYGEDLKLIAPVSDVRLLPRSYRIRGGGAGGSFSDDTQAAVERRLQEITGGDRDTPLVAYCHHYKCYLSYNLALRAAHAGYRNIYWLRMGMAAWKAMGGSFVEGDVDERKMMAAAARKKAEEERAAIDRKHETRMAQLRALPAVKFGQEYRVTKANSKPEKSSGYRMFIHEYRIVGRRGDKIKISTWADSGKNGDSDYFLMNVADSKTVSASDTWSSDGTIGGKQKSRTFTLPKDGEYYHFVKQSGFRLVPIPPCDPKTDRTMLGCPMKSVDVDPDAYYFRVARVN